MAHFGLVQHRITIAFFHDMNMNFEEMTLYVKEAMPFDRMIQ